MNWVPSLVFETGAEHIDLRILKIMTRATHTLGEYAEYSFPRGMAIIPSFSINLIERPFYLNTTTFLYPHSQPIDKVQEDICQKIETVRDLIGIVDCTIEYHPKIEDRIMVSLWFISEFPNGDDFYQINSDDFRQLLTV